MAGDWLKNRGIVFASNPDQVIYAEAERQWLSEYRNQKHFIPRKVISGI